MGKLVELYDAITKEKAVFELLDSLPNGKVIDNVLFARKGGNYYKRQNIDFVNVKWFGAKGDGINDDTIAIQKAIDAVANNFPDTVLIGSDRIGSCRIYFPAGKYRITETVVLQDLTILSGDNVNSVQIIADHPIKGFTTFRGFAENVVDMVTSHQITIENLTFSNCQIELFHSFEAKIQDCKIVNYFQDMQPALVVKFGVNNLIQRLKIKNCANGILFEDSPGSGPTTSTYFRNIWVSGTDTALEVNGNLGGTHEIMTSVIENSIFEYNRIAVMLRGKTRNLKFQNIHSEQNFWDFVIMDNVHVIIDNVWSDTLNNIQFNSSAYTQNQISLFNVPLNLNFVGDYNATLYIVGENKFVNAPANVVVKKL